MLGLIMMPLSSVILVRSRLGLLIIAVIRL